MDISPIFNTYVKSNIMYETKLGLFNSTSTILKSKKKISPFYIKIKAIVNHIAQLYSSLLKSRLIYVEHYKSNLTNLDSLEIDCVAKNIINKNYELIKELKEEIFESCIHPQNKEHKKIIVSIIEIYLRNVSEFHIELKSLKIKKVKDLKNMKIDTFKNLNTSFSSNNYVYQKINKNHDFSIQKLNNDTSETSEYEHKILTSEDVQLFEAENKHILSEFNSVSDEIKQIENKVVHIHELQEIFMENVVIQDQNLENLLTTVVGSTQNVREANEQIRKAIQNNAGFRVWILFFLLLMSFTLIFLDWYNP